MARRLASIAKRDDKHMDQMPKIIVSSLEKERDEGVEKQEPHVTPSDASLLINLEQSVTTEDIAGEDKTREFHNDASKTTDPIANDNEDVQDVENSLHDNDDNAYDIDMENFRTIKNVLKEAKLLSHLEGKEIFVSYWDLGGDELYYATHHIHLSPDAVYILVFDMIGR